MAPGHYIATPQGRTQLIHDATDKKALLEQVHALSHQLQKELNYFDNTPSSIAETAVNTPTDQPSVITAAGKQIVTESLTNAATKTATKTTTKTATGASTADTVQTGTSVEHSKESTDLELKLLNSWLKNIEDLDIAEGRRKPLVAMTFINSFKELNNMFTIQPQILLIMIRSKLSKVASTRAWFDSLRDSNQVPNSFSSWCTQIEVDCCIPQMRANFMFDLRQSRQGNMKYTEYYNIYFNLMSNAGARDTYEEAQAFIRTLNERDRTTLTNSSRFEQADDNGSLTVGLVNQIMIKALSYRRMHTEYRPTHKIAIKQIGTGFPQTAASKMDNAKISTTIQNLSEEEKQKRRRGNRCLLCNQEKCRVAYHRNELLGIKRVFTKPVNEHKGFSEVPDSSDRYESTGLRPRANFSVASCQISDVYRTKVLARGSNKPSFLPSIQEEENSPQSAEALALVTSNELFQDIRGGIKKLITTPVRKAVRDSGPLIPYKANNELLTIATIINPRNGNSTRIRTLADTGAQPNCMSLETAEKLGLQISLMDEPIEATFANDETLTLDSWTTVRVQIGETYSELVQVVICPIGNQLILGMAWWNSISTTHLDTANNIF